MNLINGLMIHNMQREIQALDEMNRLTGRYGLSLSLSQIQNLMEQRLTALKDTGRVEFGQGILPKLIYAFCDSPYLTQQNFEATLIELQDIFYYFKGEAMEEIADDELIDAMKDAFDGKGQGSVEYVAQTVLENFCRQVRGGLWEDENREERGEGEGWDD
jgi:hypothetical protein